MRKRTKYKLICETCNSEFLGTNKTCKYCSKKCLWTPEKRALASKKLREQNIKNKDKISKRMKKNNPMKDPKLIEKMMNTKRINGTLNVFLGKRGGNGILTEPQIILSSLLGWETELSIPLADHLPIGKKRQYTNSKGLPTCYKVDIGNKKLKIAIEVDGKGHKMKKKKEQDQKKEQILKQLGWRVLRFTNQEIMTNPSKVLLQIKKEIKDL